jgi:hypothetical protein
MRRIQRAFAPADPGADWARLCSLARQGRRLLQEQGRMAECYELLEQWHGAAVARGDRHAFHESARDMVWILESWGRLDDAQRLEYRRVTEWGEQLVLPF